MIEYPLSDPEEPSDVELDLAVQDAPGEGGFDIDEDLYDDDGYADDEDEY